MTVGNALFGLHADALVARGRRAELLAQNLANADTPGYRARDVDFAAVLAGVADGTLAAARTDARHLAGERAGPFGEDALLYRTPLQPSLDGNTVDADVEQGAFMQNALRYEASLRFLESRVSGLITALRGE